MAYFPFMMEAEGKRCIIAGGGKIACRKAETMLSFGAGVTLIAPELSEELESLAIREKIPVHKRKFFNEDAEGADFVIAASDDEAANSQISKICREKKIPVNVVDVKEECSFIFPAVIRRKNVIVTVSTGGESPALCAYLKNKLEKEIPDYYGDMAKMLSGLRDYIKSQVKEEENRKELYYELIRLADRSFGELSEEQIGELIEKYSR